MSDPLLDKMNAVYLRVSTLDYKNFCKATSLMVYATKRYREGDRDSVKTILEEVERIIWEYKLGDICGD